MNKEILGRGWEFAGRIALALLLSFLDCFRRNGSRSSEGSVQRDAQGQSSAFRFRRPTWYTRRSMWRALSGSLRNIASKLRSSSSKAAHPRPTWPR